jgi:hypothetical protein
MWSAAPNRSAKEAFRTLGIAPLGLLIVAARASRNAEEITDEAPDFRSPISRSWIWIGVSVVVFGIFLSVQGHGLGSLAKIAR